MSGPSTRRRTGRNMFHPGEDWKELCPYEPGSSDAEDFLDGWNEAAADWEVEQEEEREVVETFNRIAGSCPWLDRFTDQTCLASKLPCESGNCAVWHFLEETKYE